jgi:pentatricopeptide repeat protein
VAGRIGLTVVVVCGVGREYLWAREDMGSLVGGGRGSGLLQMYTCLATCHAREGHPEAALNVLQELLRAGLKVGTSAHAGGGGGTGVTCLGREGWSPVS